MLTRRQYEVLVYINDTLQKTGVSPSYDEMKKALGLHSKSGIHRLITGLEERGFIRRLPHHARAVEILRLPENFADASGERTEAASPTDSDGAADTRNVFSPNVIKGNFRIPAVSVAGESESVQLPLYGRIAAGAPIEALRDNSMTTDVPASLLGSGEHFALEVDGDSMIDAGIHDGDTVIIKRSENAENGAIVVARLEDSEVTLKRLRRKGNSIALEPANAAYKTRIFGPDQIEVQGTLVGLIRKY